MGARWEAYAARYAGEPRTSASLRSAYTPAALKALGERWEAYAAWYRSNQSR